MSKDIIINHLVQEIRVAIKEDGKLSALHYERKRDKSIVGNIYKGRVLKVLPGMEAAFLDIGLSKAAFLYVTDITVPEHDNSEEDEDALSILDDPTGEKTEKPDKPDKPEAKSATSLKINELLKEGQEVLVQVVKGSIGVKGARITCNLSIPGRNVVMLPRFDSIAVSKQISSPKERTRLKNIVKKHKPDGVGFIIRTIGQKREEDELQADIKYLTNILNKINSKFETEKAPALLHEELNLTYRTMREFLNNDVDNVYIDNKVEYESLREYLDSYLGLHSNKLKHFDKKINIFDYYDIDIEIDRALNRKVILPSGGYLIIDQAEALTAIDVNTGSFIGTNNHEETILKTNIEATFEAAYQIKLRDLGGIIVIDYIDMENDANRSKVFNLLKEELRKDKAKTKLMNFSEFGIVEMTRKRNKESLNQFLCQICPACAGSGQVKSMETIIYDIMRDIYELSRRETSNPKNFILKTNQDIAFHIEHEGLQEKEQLERMCNGSIKVQVAENFQIEQYEILEC